MVSIINSSVQPHFKQHRSNRRSREILLLAFVTGVHLVTRLDQWRYPMVGDDFLGTRDALMPIREGTFMENIWLTGGGKWRPLTTSLLLWLGKTWGYDIGNFQVLNSVLLVAVAWTAGVVAMRLGVTFLASAITAIAVVMSQFSWMAQTSIYGLMELLAVWLILMSGYFATRTIAADKRCTTNAIASVTLLFAASLTHERYVLCSFVLASSFLLLGASRETKRLAWTPILIPLFYVSTRAFILQLDPLAGGGESNLERNLGVWIGVHFWDALKMLLGGFTGSGVYYTPHPLANLRTRNDLQWLPIVAAAGFMLTTYAFVRRGFVEDEIGARRRKLRTFVLLLGFLLATLLPAATVAERIEGRWLLAPQIFLILAVGMLCSDCKGRGSFVIRHFTPAFFCMAALYYSPNSTDYLVFRDQPSQVLSKIAAVAPKSNPWVLVLSQMDTTVPAEWQFGYGNAFTQLPNPPYLASVVSGRRNDCPVLKKRIPCVVVRLNGLDQPGKPSIVLTRIVAVSRNRS